MARRLRGKVAVVTGASSGIGRATATAFASKGAAVVLAARRAEALAEVARECEQLGGRALVVPTDVTDSKAVDELARRAVEEFGRIDIWVNNAGVGLFGRLEDAPPDEYRKVIETNLFGTIHGMRAVLPYLRRQGRGVIVNNASVYGKVGAAYLSAYTTSKFGVVGLSESMRQELLADRGIAVTTVLPSSIDTPFFQHAANHMGRAVKPLRPVYDADKVAKAIVRQARRPRREVIVGSAGRMLRQQRLMSPRAWEKMQARLVERDHFERHPAASTSGNVHEPTPEWTSVSGQWPSSRGPILRKALPLLGVAAVAAAPWLWRGRDARFSRG